MTWLEYWTRLVEKKPKLENPEATVTMTVGQFERVQSQAYQVGFKQARDHAPLFAGMFDDFFPGRQGKR